jgi:hypothetical protein
MNKYAQLLLSNAIANKECSLGKKSISNNIGTVVNGGFFAA